MRQRNAVNIFKRMSFRSVVCLDPAERASAKQIVADLEKGRYVDHEGRIRYKLGR